MDIEISAISDKGPVRARNEDMLLVDRTLIRNGDYSQKLALSQEEFHFIVAVADGMGGQNAGDVASEMVIRELTEVVQAIPAQASQAEVCEALASGCHEIHNVMAQKGRENPDLAAMGSTLTGLFACDSTLYYIHVGDSRLYRYRDGVLKQITRDHSLRQVSGNENVPQNIIMNSFGGGAEIDVEMDPVGGMVLEGDCFLLCSDGLSDMLDDDVIESIMACDARLNELKDEAVRLGGKDNISLILVDIQAT